jgi:hypothetical protein
MGVALVGNAAIVAVLFFTGARAEDMTCARRRPGGRLPTCVGDWSRCGDLSGGARAGAETTAPARCPGRIHGAGEHRSAPCRHRRSARVVGRCPALAPAPRVAQQGPRSGAEPGFLVHFPAAGIAGRFAVGAPAPGGRRCRRSPWLRHASLRRLASRPPGRRSHGEDPQDTTWCQRLNRAVAGARPAPFPPPCRRACRRRAPSNPGSAGSSARHRSG